MNYAKSLKCEDCQARYKINEMVNTCKKCGGLLEVEYDYESLANDGQQRIFDVETHRCGPYLWKYIHFLPHLQESNIVSIGEGGSPIVMLKGISEKLGVKVFAKYYGTNPTGTHKDHFVRIPCFQFKNIFLRSNVVYCFRLFKTSTR